MRFRWKCDEESNSFWHVGEFWMKSHSEDEFFFTRDEESEREDVRRRTRTEKSPIYRKNSSSIIEGLMILHWSASDGMAVPISARVFLMMMVVDQVVRPCQVEGASRVHIFLTPVSTTNPLHGNETSLLADQYQSESLNSYLPSYLDQTVFRVFSEKLS